MDLLERWEKELSRQSQLFIEEAKKVTENSISYVLHGLNLIIFFLSISNQVSLLDESLWSNFDKSKEVLGRVDKVQEVQRLIAATLDGTSLHQDRFELEVNALCADVEKMFRTKVRSSINLYFVNFVIDLFSPLVSSMLIMHWIGIDSR